MLGILLDYNIEGAVGVVGELLKQPGLFFPLDCQLDKSAPTLEGITIRSLGIYACCFVLYIKFS